MSKNALKPFIHSLICISTENDCRPQPLPPYVHFVVKFKSENTIYS